MDIRKARDEIWRGASVYQLPLRVTYYARVSTDKFEQASSLENQMAHFTDFIHKNPNWVFVPGYVDEGISGTSTRKRDSFNRMISDARQGKFDFIVTKEISRFSRNTLDSIQYTQQLLQMGVAVLFQSDNINTLDTDSEFRLTVMAGVAQDEVRKLSERLKFGFRQSIKNGRVLGNDNLYGYDKDKCEMTINEEEACIVRQIFELYVNEGLGLRKISFRLLEQGITSSRGNAFNTTTIKNILLNPKYKGWYCANKSKSLDYKTHETVLLDESEWVMYPDPAIPAIVSEALWDKANAQLKQRGQVFRDSGATSSTRYAYSSKIICGAHGTPFHRQKPGKHEQWQCKVYRQQGAAVCNAPHLRTEELDRILARAFDKVIADKQKLVERTMQLLEGISPARQQPEQADSTAALRRKQEKLLELRLDGLISKEVFKQRNEELAAQIAAPEGQSEPSPGAEIDMANIKSLLLQAVNFELPQNSELAASIVEKIIVQGDRSEAKLEIHLKTSKILEVFLCSNRLRNTTPTAQNRMT